MSEIGRFAIRVIRKIIDVQGWQSHARFQGFHGLPGVDHFPIIFLFKIVDFAI